jgi:hypothetical protein
MALYRHRLEGTFPGEVWSFGLYTDSSLSLAAMQSQWMTGITNFWSTATALFCTDVETTRATTVELDPATGKQLTGAEDTRTDAGTSTATCLPFQCAPVVSLRTATLSRAGRGRFYAPSLAVDQVAAGRMLTTARDTLADAALDLVQGLTSAGGNVVIYHRATGTTSLVTSLDVGDVIDTQRRRRNKLIEARTSRPI